MKKNQDLKLKILILKDSKAFKLFKEVAKEQKFY